MPDTRRDIDAKLMASGWFVQDRDDLDLTAGRGIAAPLGELAPGFNPTGAYLEATVLPHGRLEVGYFGPH